MKLLLRLTVLSLAGFGANELYRKLAPRISGVGNRASTAVDTTLRPAMAEAGRSVQAATEFAKNKIADASRETVEAAVDPTAPSSSAPASAGRVGDSTTSRPVSEMAAHELGLDDEPKSGNATASDARG
ncbi:MAG: hypothetical protein ABIP21_02970 [Acidimicrobiia bacterium]